MYLFNHNSSISNVKSEKISSALRGQRQNEQNENALTLADDTSIYSHKFLDDWQTGGKRRDKDGTIKDDDEGNDNRGGDDERNNDGDDERNNDGDDETNNDGDDETNNDGDDTNKNDINDLDGDDGDDGDDEGNDRNDGNDGNDENKNGDNDDERNDDGDHTNKNDINEEDGDDEENAGEDDNSNGDDNNGTLENVKEIKGFDVKTEGKDENEETFHHSNNLSHEEYNVKGDKKNSVRKQEKEDLVEEAKKHLLLNENIKEHDKDMEYKDKLIEQLKSRLHNAELEIVKIKKEEQEKHVPKRKHDLGKRLRSNDIDIDRIFDKKNIHDRRRSDVADRAKKTSRMTNFFFARDKEKMVERDFYFFNPSESINLPFAIDNSSENQYAFSVWLYLSPYAEKVSRSILTTKGSGCHALKSGEKNGGISLYINRKETENHALLLDFMTTDGCKTMEAVGTIIPYSGWKHIAVTVVNKDGATLKLFVNGEIVADSANYFKSGKSEEMNTKEPIKLIPSIQEQTRLGELFEHDEYLRGSLSNLVIWKDQIIDENTIKRIFLLGMNEKEIMHDHKLREKKDEFTFFYPFGECHDILKLFLYL